MKAKAIGCLACWIVLIPLCSFAHVGVSPYLDVFYINGHMGYEIQGEGKDKTPWKSRLNFEVNNLCLGGGVAVTLADRFNLRLGGWGTVDHYPESLSDIDWSEGAEVIWSTSSESLHAWGLELEGTYRLMERDKFCLSPKAGVDYDRFDFSAYDLHQTGVNPANDVNVPGEVSTYDQQRVSLLLGVAASWTPLSWLEAEWTGSVSPVTYVWDCDDHLLRTKIAHGKGIAFVVTTGLKVGVVLWKRVHVGAWADYLYMNDYWAEQDQYWYGSADPKVHQGTRANGIDNKITRENYRVGGRLAVDF